MGKRRKAVRAQVHHTEALQVQEASGVARLPNGDFLVVDDEEGLFRFRLGEGPTSLKAGDALSDLEGICLSPEGDRAWLLSERDGAVWRFAIDGDTWSEGERLGRLPKLNSKKNQGWEGIDLAVVEGFDEPVLVAVHQKKPRAVGIFDPATLEEHALHRLPKAVKKSLGDLNDVAVHGDRIVVVSGKRGLVAELALDDGELALRRLFRVDHDDDDVPEGLCFDGEGHLWMVSDGGGWLRRIGRST